MFKGAIFDMDGVLVDNMKIHRKAMEEIARHWGVGIDIDKMMSMNGMGNAEFIEALFPPEIIEKAGGFDALARDKEALYRRIYAPTITPACGLVALLDDFSTHGVRMAVGTSAITANLDFVLDRLGIRRYFDVLVTADMVTRTKPDPEIYLRALSELGLAAGECFVFEDALAGIEAARAAGIKSVALSTSTPAPVLAATSGVALTVADFTPLDFESLNALLN